MKTPLLSAVQLSIGLALGLGHAAQPAHAFWENASQIEARLASVDCTVFAREQQVVKYSASQWDKPTSPPKAEPDAEPARSEYDPVKGKIGWQLNFRLDEKECAAFYATPADGLFNISDRRAWFRKSDFLTFRQLPRIERWTTRYVFRRTALSGANAELGINPNMISLDQEIDAYRASTIRDSLFAFTRDGYWLDFRRNMRWEMRLTPEGEIYVGDPKGRYDEEVAVFHRSYRPRCHTDADGKLNCGLYWMPRTDRCARIKDLSKEPPHVQRECQPEAMAKAERTVGTLAEMDSWYYPKGLRVSPERIVVTGRFTYGQRDPNQQVLDFIAHFDDPIRPVVFAPGVLFSDTAKPHPGRARPGEMVMKEVCLADCPDQLAAQGLVDHAAGK